jgi:hypothetical protein
VLTIALVSWAGNVVFDAQNRLPTWVGVGATLAWCVLFLTYFAARLNDSWDTEAPHRRAAARRNSGV